MPHATICTGGVRSYARQRSRATVAQKQALVELWPLYGIDYCSVDTVEVCFLQPLWPLVVDVGFGMGEHCKYQVSRGGAMNVLGIEVYAPGVGSLLRWAYQNQITTLRIVRRDAMDVFQHMIQQNSVAEISILFPDPWPKKKHHKRRLISPTFCQLLLSCLKQGGDVYCATDHLEYAQYIKAVFCGNRGFYNPYHTAQDGFVPRMCVTRAMTKYEKMAHQCQRPIFDLHVKKR